jgi:hypothetical protein
VSESEEEVARRLAEEFRNLKVEDVLVSVLIQISSIGYRRLGLTEETKEDRDLPQAKLAIDTMKALTPVLGQVVPAELVRDFEQSVANLQLAYATAASDMSGGQTPGHGQKGGEAGSDAASEPPAEAGDEAEEDTSGGQTPGHGQEGHTEEAGGEG